MGAAKEILQKYSPRAFNISEPVVQVFVGGDIKSFYTFTNFPSLYSPQTAAEYLYEVTLYAENGKPFGKKQIKVAPFGTYYFDPSKEFEGSLPEWGMIAAKIKPVSLLYNKDKHLGKITSHFYALFCDREMNSIGVVHPQIKIKRAKKHLSWKSNQIIETRNLKQIVIFQLNPTRTKLESQVSLTNEKGDIIKTQQNILNPFGSCSNSWSDFGGCENVSLSIDKMTAPNAKPLLFLVFADGSFTVSHS